MRRVLVIMGATAVGKSGVALEVAERLGCSLVSADSRQVYRGLYIGTAQPSAGERERVEHHLVDFLPLAQRFSAADFSAAALALIRSCEGPAPLVVGGTGFYLESLMAGLFPLDVAPEAMLAARSELAPLCTDDLVALLRSEDPEGAARLHPRDRQRIQRALEVKRASGVSIGEHQRRGRQRPQDIEWVCVRLALERDELHRHIAERLDSMLAAGWVDEVEGLLAGGADPAWPGLQTLGYPEIIACLGGLMDRETMRERILVRTRQYAKRQETWFKNRGAGAMTMQPSDPVCIESIAKLLES